MRWHEIICEDAALGRVIAASIRAKAGLSYAAQDAIDRWQAANWHQGVLERAYSGTGGFANDYWARRPEELAAIRREIEAAFEPVRAILRQQYGDAMPLYRGQVKVSPDKLHHGRVLFSWTADPRVATEFGQGKILKDITDDEIAAALASYARSGFAKLERYRFLRQRDNPAYFMIYRDGEQLTDGDDLEEVLRSEQRDRRRWNDRLRSQGDVVADNVPIDAIVWITNDLNCKEFICRWNPLRPR